jgi:hypothetical protein
MKKALTDNEIHIIGIQRTGQHAITSWIIGHFNKCYYKNNMSTFYDNVNVSLEPPFWFFEKGKDDWDVINSFDIKENDAFIMGTEISLPKIKLNKNLEVRKNELCYINNCKKFSINSKNLMVLRNPYNHYASILNWKRNKRLRDPNQFIKVWLSYVNEILNEGSSINNKIVVIYDKWFSSIDYRKSISQQLGLNFSDARLNTVMKIGINKSWGSSFDGMNYKNKAQNMDVLNRYKDFIDDEKFKIVYNNIEIKEKCKILGIQL